MNFTLFVFAHIMFEETLVDLLFGMVSFEFEIVAAVQTGTL